MTAGTQPRSMHRASVPVPACARCAAVCCRLTAILQPDDDVPVHLTALMPNGDRAMTHDGDGWCVALDHARMNCGIYAQQRPQVCRRFVMDGPYCRAVRVDYRRDRARGSPLQLDRGGAAGA